jgi:hypothetical protein
MKEGRPSSDGVVGFGRIWPCISRDVMRAPCIVKARAGGPWSANGRGSVQRAEASWPRLTALLLERRLGEDVIGNEDVETD